MTTYFIRDKEYSEEQISNIQQEQLCMGVTKDKPSSLFKYYPNLDENGKNYSIEALQNNTVHLSNPDAFDDPYDSNAFIDEQKYKKSRIRYYFDLCCVSYDEEEYQILLDRLADIVYKHILSGEDIDFLLREAHNDFEVGDRKIFILEMKCLIQRGHFEKAAVKGVIEKIVNDDYKEEKKSLKRFRISCFSENPYLMLMWSHYANNHRGFCVEYEIPKFSSEYASLLDNIYPVIYSDKRTELTAIFIRMENDGGLTREDLSEIYKFGLICKSIDWKYQKEWRLIALDDIINVDENNNCVFFRIKKVYLGNKMQPKERKEIIQICKEKNIPYAGVTISDDKYEMKDCDLLCENCYRMKP